MYKAERRQEVRTINIGVRLWFYSRKMKKISCLGTWDSAQALAVYDNEDRERERERRREIGICVGAIEMMWVGRNTRVGARGNKTSRHIVGWGEEEVDRAVECRSGRL
jgi:hypothetical protein